MAGSTGILLRNAPGISVGKYLVIAEINNASYVSTAGSEGNCNWSTEPGRRRAAWREGRSLR